LAWPELNPEHTTYEYFHEKPSVGRENSWAGVRQAFGLKASSVETLGYWLLSNVPFGTKPFVEGSLHRPLRDKTVRRRIVTPFFPSGGNALGGDYG
jgi:hypothetical protein